MISKREQSPSGTRRETQNPHNKLKEVSLLWRTGDSDANYDFVTTCKMVIVGDAVN